MSRLAVFCVILGIGCEDGARQFAALIAPCIERLHSRQQFVSQESIGVQFAIDAAFLFLALGVGKLSLELFFALRGRLHALHLLAVCAGFGQCLAYYVGMNFTG